MKVLVYGIGYVGVVTAACLSRDGHDVVAADVVQEKVDLLNAGLSPIIEPQVPDLVRSAVAANRLRATTSPATEFESTDIAFVCVGSPSASDGRLDVSAVTKVIRQVGELLRTKKAHTLVVVRSTLQPGTMDDVVVPQLVNASGRSLGDGYDVLFHPEFLREGCAVADYDRPPKIVVGASPDGSGSRILLDLYKDIDANVFVTSFRNAEMVKFADNVFHALKITFANEMGQFCSGVGADARQVLEIFRADTKLNISPAYLKPGFAFGGSCLPKDTRAITSTAGILGLKLPLLGAILSSNEFQLSRAVRHVIEMRPNVVGIHGLAFKPDTDDLRESPFVELCERLLGKGVRLKIFDGTLDYSRLTGVNKRYVTAVLPHLAELLVPHVRDFVACDLIVIGHPVSREIVDSWLAEGKRILDLTGVSPHQHSNYQSIV